MVGSGEPWELEVMGPIPGHKNPIQGEQCFEESDFSSARGLPAVAIALVAKMGFCFSIPVWPYTSHDSWTQQKTTSLSNSFSDRFEHLLVSCAC